MTYFWVGLRVLLLLGLTAVAGLGTEATTDQLLNQIQGRPKDKAVENALRQLVQHTDSVATNPIYTKRLAELVQGSPDSLRELSAFALGKAGGEAVLYIPVLEHAVRNDSKPQVKRAAADALGRIGVASPEVLSTLMAAAQAASQNDDIEHLHIRIACMEALARLEPRPLAVQHLTSNLAASEPVEIRAAATYTLAGFGPDAAPAVPFLIRALDPRNPENGPGIRQVTAWTLGSVGPFALDAVPALVNSLRDPDSAAIRRVSAQALGHIGADQESVLDALTQSFVAERDLDAKTAMAIALADLARGPNVATAFFAALRYSQDRALQQAAATGLSRVVPPPNPDIGMLVKISAEEYPDVRVAAINAIGHIHQQPDKAIPALVTALSDPIPSVRLAATDALGQFSDLGTSGTQALDGLSNALKNGTTRFAAARALSQIGDSVTDRFELSHARSDFALIPPLKRALKVLDDLQNSDPSLDFSDTHQHLSHALTTLTNGRLLHLAEGWFTDHPLAAWILTLAALYLAWVAILYLAILRLFPLSLIRGNDFLQRLGEIRVPALGLLAVKFRGCLLHNTYRHPRVLAAWVEAHAEAARINFANQCRMAHEVYCPLPVGINGEVMPALTPAALRPIFGRRKFFLRILGEGGLGKTTLSRQIALWAVDHNPRTRLLPDRRLIPVVLERATGSTLDDLGTFKSVIRGKLQDLIGEAKLIPNWLCESLLRDGRILVIIDGLSEVPARFEQPLPQHPEYSLAALIVTSRSPSLWSEVIHDDVRPMRLDSDHLSRFLRAYLGSIHLPDTELYEACRRLAMLVGNRSITPLLARMYAEQLASALESRRRLPENIPDLVLGYVSALNRTRKPEDPDHTTVQHAAKLAAWECCRTTYSPGFARKEQVFKAFAAADLRTDLLDYLETRLQLVRTIPPAETYIEFSLDPLAEYLAGLWLLQRLGSDHEWSAFLKAVDEAASKADSRTDFLAAVWDCCTHGRENFRGSESVLEELSSRLRRKEPASAA
jgi:HEAT repeat protein